MFDEIYFSDGRERLLTKAFTASAITSIPPGTHSRHKTIVRKRHCSCAPGPGKKLTKKGAFTDQRFSVTSYLDVAARESFDSLIIFRFSGGTLL